MASINTIEFKDGKLCLLDQRKLPKLFSIFECQNYRDVEFAIKDMVVRGAPAIGVAGAYGLVLAASEFIELPKEEFLEQMKESVNVIGNSRPTAVNLMWAVKRMEAIIEENKENPMWIFTRLYWPKPIPLRKEDLETNKAIARHGNEIVLKMPPS